MMIGVLLFLVAATALCFHAGFIGRVSPYRFRAQAGFVVGLGLVALTGYFVWREHQTVSELARLIDPVPKITQLTYVPNPDEIQALAKVMASVPGKTRTGNTQVERRAYAQSTEGLDAHYWLLRTALSPEEIIRFYAEPQHRKGWKIRTAEGPWMVMEGPEGSLTIFVAEDWPRPGTRVLYMREGA